MAQHGIVKAIRHFAKDFKDKPLKESTVFGWKKLHLEELEIQRRESRDMNITKLPSKKMGHPLMLGNAIDKQVRTYLMELRSVGVS